MEKFYEHICAKKIYILYGKQSVDTKNVQPLGTTKSSATYNQLNSKWLFLLSIISRRKLRISLIFPFFILFRPIIFHAISIRSPSAPASPGPVQLRWWRSFGIPRLPQIYDSLGTAWSSPVCPASIHVAITRLTWHKQPY